MDKNRIRGIRRRTSRQRTTKSRSIKGAGCKSGGCALKVVELTSGDLPSDRDSGQGGVTRPDRTEGVRRRHIRSARSKTSTNGMACRTAFLVSGKRQEVQAALVFLIHGVKPAKLPRKRPNCTRWDAGPKPQLSVIDQPWNRRVRIRTYGGLGGVEPRVFPHHEVGRTCSARKEKGERLPAPPVGMPLPAKPPDGP